MMADLYLFFICSFSSEPAVYAHQRQSIDLNTAALVRIVAGLFALLGLTAGSVPARIPLTLHRAIRRVLRPAESAARRLIDYGDMIRIA